jgi:hypothetical protein
MSYYPYFCGDHVKRDKGWKMVSTEGRELDTPLHL